jgi:hypothetical protein
MRKPAPRPPQFTADRRRFLLVGLAAAAAYPIAKRQAWASPFRPRLTPIQGVIPIAPPTILTSGSQVVSENNALSLPLATDQIVTWSIIGGADQALFSVAGSTLSLPAQDYEPPPGGGRADANLDSIYVVQLQATSVTTGLTATKTISVSVADVAEGSGVMTVVMRSDDLAQIDVTSLLLQFRDVGADRITVTTNGANLTAKIWAAERTNFRNFTNGQSGGHVRAGYVNFHVATSSMPDGQTQSITFSGVDVAGSPLSTTLNITCADDPAAIDWAYGALTRGMFGGPGIHDLLKGNSQHWSIKSQTWSDSVTDRMVMIYDPTAYPSVNLGTGRIYANGLSRLVLDGTTTGSIKTQAQNGTGFNTAPWDRYGGTVKRPVTAGVTTGTVVLQNSDGLPDRTFNFTFPASQVDVAPWPMLDSLDPGGAADAANQPGWTARCGNTYMRWSNTWIFEDGVHSFGSRGIFQPGFTFGFGTTAIGGTAPAGPFNGPDPYVYSEGVGYDANLWTWRPRTPHCYLQLINGINGTSINKTATNKLGLRITGFKLGGGPSYSAGGSMTILHVDRCHCEYLEDATKKPTFNTGSSISNSAGFQHCYVKGALGCTSTDMQLWDIRQEDMYPGEGGGNAVPAGTAPIDMLGTGVTQWNSDDNVFRAQIAFLYQFNRQGMDLNGHQDSWQWTNGGAATGRHAGPRVVCLWSVPGDRRVSTGTYTFNGTNDAGQLKEGGTEGIFHSPLPSTMLCDGHYMGILNVANFGTFSMFLAAPGRRTRLLYCMLIRPDRTNVSNFDGTTGTAPQFQFKSTSSTTAAEVATMKIQNNVIWDVIGGPSGMCAADPSYFSGNIEHILPGGANDGWHLTHLNDPMHRQEDLQTLELIISRYGYKVGQEVDAGPFSSNAPFDPLRRTYDATVFA